MRSTPAETRGQRGSVQAEHDRRHLVPGRPQKRGGLSPVLPGKATNQTSPVLRQGDGQTPHKSAVSAASFFCFCSAGTRTPTLHMQTVCVLRVRDEKLMISLAQATPKNDWAS